MLFLAFSYSSYGAEKSELYRLDIPQQGMAAALTSFARQVKQPVLFPYRMVKGIASNRLQGTYSAVEGIELLLHGTGLSPVFGVSGVITIKLAVNNKKIDGDNNMNSGKKRLTGFATIVAALFGSADIAEAEDKRTSTIEEVLVTAQKRQQSINDVPMSISAISGDALADKGIESVADLQKVVTGFRYSESNQGTPIYYIRGVGFNEASIGARPNVAVYVDEVAIPFPVMTGGVGLDLERVEVLKGPQGTLFGQNTTSGAINYISAKPSDDFEASITAGLGRFEQKTVRGYVSGPIAESVSARAALKWEDSGPWQQSSTSNRELGDKDKLTGRFIVNWQPAESVNLSLTYFSHRDKSDLRANQFQSLSFQQDALARMFLPAATVAEFENYPVAAQDNRAADWGPIDPQQDSDMDQISFRSDWDITDSMTLTYIYSNAEFEMDRIADTDGVSLDNFTVNTLGDISSDAHELRLAGAMHDERVRWMVGVNYDNSDVSQLERLSFEDTGNAFALVAASGGDLNAFFNTTDNDTFQEFSTSALFTSFDFTLTDTLSAHASARYTDSEVDFSGCTMDAGDGVLANAFNIGLFGGNPTVPVGGCITLDVATFSPVRVTSTLEENNLSWRVGFDWQPDDANLYYFNISRGFKNGSFPNLSASEASQYTPVTEESLLAYEAGFKLGFPEKAMQFSGALFHYNYKDKQIRGRVVVPVFGPLEALVNVPDSEVYGIELQYDWKPSIAWTVGFNLTYLETEINDFQGFDTFGQPGNFDGEPFPNTPDVAGNLDVQYDWSFANGSTLFVGGNVSYQDSTNSNFGEQEPFDVDSYTLLDLRAGFNSPDDSWSVLLWGQNVTDEYYWVSANRSVDTNIRVAGEPQAYGIEFTYRWY